MQRSNIAQISTDYLSWEQKLIPGPAPEKVSIPDAVTVSAKDRDDC